MAVQILRKNSVHNANGILITELEYASVIIVHRAYLMVGAEFFSPCCEKRNKLIVFLMLVF